MRFWFAFFILLSLPALADTTFTSRIHDIDLGNSPADAVLVLMDNGRVARLSVNKTNSLDELNEAKAQGTLLNIGLDHSLELISFSEAEEISSPETNFMVPLEKDLLDYTPSIIGSAEYAKKIFKDHKYNSKDSQCYNRAHIWSYEWRVKHNLYSSKIWIFFTRKFLREHANFEWWFHVAPMNHVNEEGVVKERVFDVKYSRGPVSLQKWAAIFMRGKGPCPTVTTYSDHANYPYDGYCYLQKSSMYFYQPVDLEFLEKYGSERNGWLEAEVRAAYLEAFDITP